MQVAARLPIPVRRAANSRPTPELSPQAANRLKLLEQWRAMCAEGMTATKAAAILRVPRACLFRWQSRLRERGAPASVAGWLSPMEYLAAQRLRTAY